MCVRAVVATWVGAVGRLVCSVAPPPDLRGSTGPSTARDTTDEGSVGRAGEEGVGMFVVDGDDGYDWVGIGMGEDGLIVSRVEVTLLSFIKQTPLTIYTNVIYVHPPAKTSVPVSATPSRVKCGVTCLICVTC